jgi:hypothetical protein
MIKQYVFNNINDLKNLKINITLPEIKNGKYIDNIYEKIIKEVKIQVFINNILDKEIMDDNIKIFNNTNLDYLYNIQNYKIMVHIHLYTDLYNMCIWNLEYSPHISGEIIIN